MRSAAENARHPDHPRHEPRLVLHLGGLRSKLRGIKQLGGRGGGNGGDVVGMSASRYHRNRPTGLRRQGNLSRPTTQTTPANRNHHHNMIDRHCSDLVTTL